MQIIFTTSEESIYEISITDMQGKTLLKKPVNATVGSNTVSLDITNLSKGAYLLKLQSKNEVKVEKIVKE